MKEYLILISVGPVQEFIASARKLRDLWFGSYILSELSKTVARLLHEHKATLIFPAISDPLDLQPASKLNVANKILARFASSTLPDQLILQARDQWMGHINELSEKTLAIMRKQFSFLQVKEEMFKQQIADYGEFFGVWTELGNHYTQALGKVNALLAGRKMLRHFMPVSWDGAGIPKNSLDGLRESVLGRDKANMTGLLKGGEKLDALGCIKRFYPLENRNSSPHFDDLSEIALVPYLKGIGLTANFGLLKDYEKCFITPEEGHRREQDRQSPYAALTIQADLLYAEEETLKQLLGPKRAKDAFLKLSHLTNSRHAGLPPKYAAILLGDGDRMGEAIQAISNMEGHQKFSHFLSLFASKVGETIAEYDGSLIYAGGDDVLAYVPVHTMLSCAEAINRLFAQTMTKMAKELNLKSKPSFSIGLAIVHHSAPLDQALNVARRAEKMAKHEAGRNALAIIQDKRSGSETAVYGKWQEDQDPWGFADKKLAKWQAKSSKSQAVNIAKGQENTDQEEKKQWGFADRMLAICEMYNQSDVTLSATLGYQLRRLAIECGDELSFSRDEQDEQSKIKADNAAAAGVLYILKQKEIGEEFLQMLWGQTSIKSLAAQLVVGRQIAHAMGMVQANGQKKVENEA